jgi:glucan phosphoethanolaminetransferase (alkaline phosphatase superfamily)
MFPKTTIPMRKWTRKLSIFCLFLIFVAIGFASSTSLGGGDQKSKTSLMNNFTPIRSTSGFTLRATKPSFSGGFVHSLERTDNRLSINTLITYQRGNTTYILPYKYRVAVPSFQSPSKTNLQLFGVKIKMPK